VATPKAQTDLLLPFLDDRLPEIQIRAAIKLSEIDSQVTNGLPVLMRAATNNNYISQVFTNSPSLRVTLPGRLASNHPYYQRKVHEALQKISPELAEQVRPGDL
jgi:hypothetical protein